MSEQTTTPEVAAAATISTELPESGLLLLGTFSAPEGGAALLRLSDGTIARVTPGDETGAGEVLSIGDGQITFARAGEEVTLGMIG
ncbi:pilus assembly protein PilP [Pseudoroseicyclus tamaricis]|uniref:Pilus assembly protein PilP n=1 Tax=Pseudoroseicyclus tamaricis TaxID=2705421 RepID=A0A6B2JXG7_9RHOB|nr:pilus assembly protein PilP [Pseudoroseicyclus tamaricis]NDV00964.1 pilus assembly protein PilP [Pseudoroseicyclus tamaricis]